MIGTYSYLRYYGLNPIISFVATVGIEFGGVFFEVVNILKQLGGAYPTEILVLLIGLLWTLNRLIYGIAIFHKFNEWFGSQDNPQIYSLLVGLAILIPTVTVAVVIDLYVLPADAQRVPGIVYTLSNLDSTIMPLADSAGDYFLQDTANQTVNQSQTINTTLNNSSTG